MKIGGAMWVFEETTTHQQQHQRHMQVSKHFETTCQIRAAVCFLEWKPITAVGWSPANKSQSNNTVTSCLLPLGWFDRALRITSALERSRWLFTFGLLTSFAVQKSHVAYMSTAGGEEEVCLHRLLISSCVVLCSYILSSLQRGAKWIIQLYKAKS